MTKNRERVTMQGEKKKVAAETYSEAAKVVKATGFRGKE